MSTETKQAEYIQGDFEVELPVPWLKGSIGMEYHEVGEAPSRIIDVNDDWVVEVIWSLSGSLARFMCGTWCVQLFLESIGPGEEYEFGPYNVPLNPCGDGNYKTTVDIKGGKIKVPKPGCAIPYKVVVSITYVDSCGEPGPIAGFVEGPIVQFYPME